MPRVVFGMQVGVGRGDVGVPQVVPHHLEVHLIAEMVARRMTCLLRCLHRRCPDPVGATWIGRRGLGFRIGCLVRNGAHHAHARQRDLANLI